MSLFRLVKCLDLGQQEPGEALQLLLGQTLDWDGARSQLEALGVRFGGDAYIAVLAEADLDLVIMKVGNDDEGEYMDIVDDDEELITVGKVFEERLRAMYDIDDSELQ